MGQRPVLKHWNPYPANDEAAAKETTMDVPVISLCGPSPERHVPWASQNVLRVSCFDGTEWDLPVSPETVEALKREEGR